MKAKKAMRLRAQALPDIDVGALRYSLYKEGHARIQAAISAGYFLEAISLIESLMSDRLESRLSHLTGSNVAFQNLGPLIDLMRQHEKDADVLALVTAKVDNWRRGRNSAAHEMLKIEVGDTRSWDVRQDQLKTVAASGYRVLKELSKLLDRGRPRRRVR